MELTYDRMNRKLSFAAAAVQALVIVLLAINLISWIFFSLPFWGKYDNSSSLLQNLSTHILNLTFGIVLFILLLRAKKGILTGILLLLPVICTALSLTYTFVIYILLLPEGEPMTVSYGSIALSLVGFVNAFIYRGILATACFTKGRIFGQRFRILLPIMAIGYVLLDILCRIFSAVIIVYFASNTPIFVGFKELLAMSLRDTITWRNILTQLPYYAVVILTALAFFHPAKAKAKEL